MKIFKTDDYSAMSRKAANILASQIILKPDSVLGESATINWTDFLRAYTINPYEERNFNYVREKTT